MNSDRGTIMTSQGTPAPPLEDDNILSMILCRLPPLPSSIPRAGLVCKRWRRLVTHPHFRRSFLAHHKKGPLLGFFCDNYYPRIDFRAALEPPNRMPVARFTSCLLSQSNRFLGCHHGHLLVLNISYNSYYLVVWDPITGDRRHVDIPEMFQGNKVFDQKGVVVCASREKDHIHGTCHSEPFQVVIIGCNMEGYLACVYSSETCTWGNLISLLQPPRLDTLTFDVTVPADCQSSLVGNSVYWVPVATMRGAVLEFNLDRQTLALIDAPPDAYFNNQNHQSFIVPADGGGLSFIVLSDLRVHVWKSISNGHGVAGWLFEDNIELGNLLSLKPRDEGINIHGTLSIVGLDEDDNMIFRLRESGTIYLVHLKTLQMKELSEKIDNDGIVAHPFSSFYTEGMHAVTGTRGDEKE